MVVQSETASTVVKKNTTVRIWEPWKQLCVLFVPRAVRMAVCPGAVRTTVRIGEVEPDNSSRRLQPSEARWNFLDVGGNRSNTVATVFWISKQG